MGPVLVLVAVGVIAWILLALPVRRRQHAHAAMQDAIAAGDEIITAGGLHAFVREAGEQELRVEIAPGVLVTLDRRAVAAVAQEEQNDDDEEGLEGEEESDNAVPFESAALPAEEEPMTDDEPVAEGGSVASQTDTS